MSTDPKNPKMTPCDGCGTPVSDAIADCPDCGTPTDAAARRAEAELDRLPYVAAWKEWNQTLVKMGLLGVPVGRA